MVKDVLRLHIHLAGSQLVLELHRIRFWQRFSCRCPHDVDSEARVLDGCQKCVKLEIADKLRSRRDNVGRIEVIPDVFNFADRDPMVSLVCNEPLLRRVVRCLHRGRAYRGCLNVLELLQGP